MYGLYVVRAFSLIINTNVLSTNFQKKIYIFEFYIAYFKGKQVVENGSMSTFKVQKQVHTIWLSTQGWVLQLVSPIKYIFF